MLDKSLFISETIHERVVKLPDGSEHTLHFKELPATIFRAFHLAEQSDNEDTQVGSMAKLIASSLCEPDGKAAITYKEALKLTAPAANALVNAVLSVNGFGGKSKNDLPPETMDGSGESSSSPLAAAP
jgi:hypothetical protein